MSESQPVLVYHDEDQDGPLGPEREEYVLRNGAMVLSRTTLSGGCVLLRLRQPPGFHYRSS